MLPASNTLRLEDEFILACICLGHSESQKNRVMAMITGPLDWQYVLRASLRHCVFPIVFKNLYAALPDAIPPDFLNKFRTSYRTNVVRNVLLTTTLVKIVDELEQNGVLAVPFKGPLLGEYLYGDFGLRIFGDLDILVRKDDALHAMQILSGLGYTPALKLSPSQLARYMAYEDDLVFFNQKVGLVVEVHWEMSGRYLSRAMDMHFVHDGLRPFRLMNRDVMHLSNEDLLLYLCVHGAKHMWERLEWIFSVAELIRVQQGLKWDLVLQKADEFRCRRLVLHSICLAEEIFRVGLPHNIVRLLSADNKLPALNGQIKSRLFPLVDEAQAPRIGRRFNYFQMQLRDSLVDGVGYAIRELTEPKEADWHWLALPGSLSFLYVFLRPLRTFLKVGNNMLKRMFGKNM